MGSVVYQVKDTLQRIFVPGVSRNELKYQGVADRRITSFSALEGYLDICVCFAKHCEAIYHIDRRIGNITPEMAEAYIQQMRERELSGGYIGKVKAAIRKLDAAMKERAGVTRTSRICWHLAVAGIRTDDRGGPTRPSKRRTSSPRCGRMPRTHRRPMWWHYSGLLDYGCRKPR